MLYKEDWPEARQRMEAFWEGEVLDRVCLAVTAPADNKVGEIPEPVSDEARFTDIEFIIEFNNALFRNIFFGGEALPVPTVRLGYVAHGHPEVRFFPNTVWGRPWLSRSSPQVYQFDPDNRWWRRVWQIQNARTDLPCEEGIVRHHQRSYGGGSSGSAPKCRTLELSAPLEHPVAVGDISDKWQTSGY